LLGVRKARRTETGGYATLPARIKDDVMDEQYSFSIVLEPQEGGGFTVLVPALPEVVTEGDSESEALTNAEEAIRAVLAYRRDNGIAIPEIQR
jgi:antitoxin HicB